jgi:tetratricopeptide (TPR) repeat protein
MDEVQQLKDQLSRSEGNNKQIQEEYAEAVNQIAAAEWFERGSAYSQAGNYGAAARSYNQAMMLRPQDPKIYMNRSIVYIQTGNYQYAAQDLDKAASLNAQSANAYLNRAVIYKRAYEERRVKTTDRATPNRFRQDFRDQRKDDPLQRVIDSRRTQLNAGKRAPGTPALRGPEPIRPTTPAPDIQRSNAPVRRDARPETNREKIRKEREEARKTRIEVLKKKNEEERANRKKDKQKKPHEEDRKEKQERTEHKSHDHER